MARPGLLKHPKFLRLVHTLALPIAHALGYLELLWHGCFERGDAYLGDELDVELSAGWPGERGVLCRALLACRLIDEIEPGKFQVHDLEENSPEYVRSRIRMRRKRAKDKSNEGTEEASTYEQSEDALRNGDVTVRKCSEQLRTPSPPLPSQSKEEATASSCSEPQAAHEPTHRTATELKPFLSFPTVGPGAKEWQLSEEKVNEYREAFPGVDVPAECRAALQWCRDNPTKRKTPRGMPAFLTRWLTNAQNKPEQRGANRNGHARKPSPGQRYDPSFDYGTG